MRARRERRGFTLLETAIVLAITAIGALLVLPLWPSATAPVAPRDETPGAGLAAALASARRQAITARQTVDVHIDAAQRHLRIDTTGAAGRGVWQDTILPIDAADLLVTADTTSRVRFQPSGAAESRPMSLRHPYGWVAFVIDPWSGEVHRVAR